MLLVIKYSLCMVGAHHSVSTFFKQLVPNIVVFKCVCHSLQLAASKVAAVLPSYIDFLIRESYNWFSHSSKRLCDYRELHMKLTNEVPNKLLQLSATRWMSQYECVKRILDQWKVLQDFFHQAALEEKCYTTRQLDCIYQDPKNYVYLIFLESILKDFSRLNKLFELRDADVVSLGDDFVLFYQSLLQRIVVPDKRQAVSAKDLLCYDFEPDVLHTNRVHYGYAFLKGVEEKSLTVDDIAEVIIQMPENVIFQAVSTFSPSQILSATGVTMPAVRFKNICKDVEATNVEMKLLCKVPMCESVKKDLIQFWNTIRNFIDAGGMEVPNDLDTLLLLP